MHRNGHFVEVYKKEEEHEEEETIHLGPCRVATAMCW